MHFCRYSMYHLMNLHISFWKYFHLKKLPKYFERYFRLKVHALKLLPLVFRVSAVSDGCCRVCCAVWSSGRVRVLWRPAVYVGVDEGVWMQERVWVIGGCCTPGWHWERRVCTEHGCSWWRQTAKQRKICHLTLKNRLTQDTKVNMEL